MLLKSGSTARHLLYISTPDFRLKLLCKKERNANDDALFKTLTVYIQHTQSVKMDKMSRGLEYIEEEKQVS